MYMQLHESVFSVVLDGIYVLFHRESNIFSGVEISFLSPQNTVLYESILSQKYLYVE